MSCDIENDFAHNEDDKRASRSILLTAFRDPDWNELDRDSTDWSKVIDLSQLAIEINSAYSHTKSACKFIHYQWEVCPTTEKVHIHMIISFDTPVKWANLRKCTIIASFTRVNFKPVFALKGALEYCSKVNTKDGFHTQIAGPYTYGTAPNQGARNDLKNAIDWMSEHAWDPKSVAHEFPEVYVKFNRGLDRLSEARAVFEPASKLENIILLFGPPGSGKSYYVYDHWPENEIYSLAYVKYSNFYHDGYRNHPVIHYDEFSGHCMPFDTFKRLYQPGMDPRRSMLAMREGSIPLGSGTVIFTSNRLPTVWWDLVKIKANPWELFRRFTKIIVFGGEYGDDLNPSWHSELTTVTDRKRFMTACLNARDGDWDADTISRTMHDLFYNTGAAVAQSTSGIVSSSIQDSVSTQPIKKPRTDTEWALKFM